MEEQAKQDQKWWQKNKKLLMRNVLIALIAVVIVLIILIILGYIFNWDWTGLNATDVTSTPQKPTSIIVYQPGKTLWDWLQLLIIPAVLAVAGYVINLTVSRNEQAATEQRAQSEREAAEKRAETEREIALDNQRETSLQEYIDKLSELIIHEGLLGTDPKKEVREIARLRTLTVLNRLDGNRRGSVLQFLRDSELISKDKAILYLDGANLSEANLCETHLSGTRLVNVDLSGANLSGAHLGFAYTSVEDGGIEGADLASANLTGANLSGAFLVGSQLSHPSNADLSGADLSGANLKGAIVTKEQLDQAKSLKGATMIDGSKHP